MNLNLNRTKDKIIFNIVALTPLALGLFWGLTFHFHSIIWAWICTGFVVISGAWTGLLYGFWVALTHIKFRNHE